jgi:four helix bundle protein
MIQQGQRTQCQLPRHFDHHRLDAWHVAKQALIEGHRILKDMPRGFAALKDQGQRALSNSFSLTSEAAARTGADRACRMRWARAEANEAAAVFEAIGEMGLIEADRIDAQLALLWRLSAMLTGLSRSARR